MSSRPAGRSHASKSILLLALILGWTAGWPFAPGSHAQVQPIYSEGVIGLVQEIQQLQTTASALHVGAHPDDEDTGFIARLARGDHARVAYLSLNRGEGGQNVIGPELFEALGVIRTEELLQARTLDGGDQFFTRAYDFGFSKSVDEAASKWDENEVLCDMVRIIRRYRPLVVYAGFSGTPADGHGQHQLAGRLAPLAFRAAADPARFPEQLAEGLRPWQVTKLYVRQGFRADPSNPPTLQLQTGRYDPLLGRTYFEIAMEGRSQHKSQEMGVPVLRGPHSSAMRLVESLVPTPAEETSVFDGIDTTLAGLPRLAGMPGDTLLNGELAAVQRAITSALDHLDPTAPSRTVQPLAEGLRAVRSCRELLTHDGSPEAARMEADFLLTIKERQFERALTTASGTIVDPLSDTETVAPGETLRVDVRSFLAQPDVVSVTNVVLRSPEGWTVAKAEATEAAPSNPIARFFRESPDRTDSFEVHVPDHAAFTQPYWLERPRTGDMFDWPPSMPEGLPFAPPPLTAEVHAQIAGVNVTLTPPVNYRLVDPVRGELRRELAVVPALSIVLDPQLDIVPIGALGKPRRVALRIESESRHEVTGTARLQVPEGWEVFPVEATFAVARKGDRTSVGFNVTPPESAHADRYRLGAVALVEGRRLETGMRTIAYPHIQTHRTYGPAEAQVRVFDLKVAPVNVGYVMGTGDQMPDAIRRMGLRVQMLGEDDLVSGDLAPFDVIVVGIRASESRPDFVANHGRLMAYVRAGGTLIVQYQQPDYLAKGLAPFPAEMASRVADETAPVKVLVPDHPVFTAPNRITDADWQGWIQDRNLYAFTKFDPRYTPMLETADPGESPQQGGQVIARIERGIYIYTAYAWFRQLPAGVPGAYRLFANLLSLPRTLGANVAAVPKPTASRSKQ
jgi:LmbE family N-acetylglucosaminyl deacetylase